jgi:hypothetical protein
VFFGKLWTDSLVEKSRSSNTRTMVGHVDLETGGGEDHSTVDHDQTLSRESDYGSNIASRGHIDHLEPVLPLLVNVFALGCFVYSLAILSRHAFVSIGYLM